MEMAEDKLTKNKIVCLATTVIYWSLYSKSKSIFSGIFKNAEQLMIPPKVCHKCPNSGPQTPKCKKFIPPFFLQLSTGWVLSSQSVPKTISSLQSLIKWWCSFPGQLLEPTRNCIILIQQSDKLYLLKSTRTHHVMGEGKMSVVASKKQKTSKVSKRCTLTLSATQGALYCLRIFLMRSFSRDKEQETEADIVIPPSASSQYFPNLGVKKLTVLQNRF